MSKVPDPTGSFKPQGRHSHIKSKRMRKPDYEFGALSLQESENPAPEDSIDECASVQGAMTEKPGRIAKGKLWRLVMGIASAVTVEPMNPVPHGAESVRQAGKRKRWTQPWARVDESRWILQQCLDTLMELKRKCEFCSSCLCRKGVENENLPQKARVHSLLFVAPPHCNCDLILFSLHLALSRHNDRMGQDAWALESGIGRALESP